MRHHGVLAAVLVVAGLVVVGSGGPAFGQVKFERKYAEETKAVSRLETKADQTITVAGMDIKQKSSSFILQSTQIGKRRADGTLSLEKKVDTLQAEYDFGGIKLQFDSGNPDKKADDARLQVILDALKASLQGSTIIVLNKANELQEVKVDPKVVEALPEAFRSNATADKAKARVNQELSLLPQTSVKPGETWDVTHTMALDGSQSFEFVTAYTFTGNVEKDGKSLQRVEVQDKSVKYAMEADAKGGAQVSKSDLKVTESQGEILFDAVAGRVQQRANKVRIVGDITLVIAGVNYPAKLDLTLDTKETVEP